MTLPDSDDAPPEPAQLKLLRRLVTVLTVVFIAGLITVTGLLVLRLTSGTPVPALPEGIALPAGERLTGYAQNPDWLVLITTDGGGIQRLHLVPAGATEIRQSVRIGAAP